MSDWGWRTVLSVKSPCCSIMRTGVWIPTPTSGGSQVPVTPAPRDLMYARPCAGTCPQRSTHTHTDAHIKGGSSKGIGCGLIGTICFTHRIISRLVQSYNYMTITSQIKLHGLKLLLWGYIPRKLYISAKTSLPALVMEGEIHSNLRIHY